MSRPRSSAATVLAKTVPFLFMANADRLGEKCMFLSMANGIGENFMDGQPKITPHPLKNRAKECFLVLTVNFKTPKIFLEL